MRRRIGNGNGPSPAQERMTDWDDTILLHGTETGRFIGPGSNMTEVERPRVYPPGVWPNCPRCHQPATNMYQTSRTSPPVAACNRCHWIASAWRD